MSNLLSKRVPAPITTQPASSTHPDPVVKTVHARSRQHDRLAAIAQAKCLDTDEDAALAFLLHCEFSDARIIAAEQIKSEPAMAQAWAAIRNIDRRVAKLLHARLQCLTLFDLRGGLENSLAFAGDPLEIQQKLRNEWD
jgi:hypothetical protein